MKRAIIILHRLSVSGLNSKTRIGKAIHSQVEANIFSEMLLKILLNNIKEFGGDIFIYSPKASTFEQSKEIQIVGRTIECLPEERDGGILTQIVDGIKKLQKRGYEEIVCVVSDVPYMEQIHFDIIFNLLNDYDIVICPAKDGGINAYAVHNDSILDWICSGNEISRSKDYHLLDDIEKNLKLLKLNYYIYEKKYSDIDTLDDIKEFYNYIINKKEGYKKDTVLIKLIEKWMNYKKYD